MIMCSQARACFKFLSVFFCELFGDRSILKGNPTERKKHIFNQRKCQCGIFHGGESVILYRMRWSHFRLLWTFQHTNRCRIWQGIRICFYFWSSDVFPKVIGYNVHLGIHDSKMYKYPSKSVNNVAGTKIRTFLNSLSNSASIRYNILVRIALMMKK